MKAFHVLSLVGGIALTGVLLAQVTGSGGTSTQTSGSSSQSSRSSHSSSSSQSSRDQGQMGMIDLSGKKVFAVINRPGDNWKANEPIMNQDLDAHVAYLEKLKASNILVMAGPFMDSTGGEYVIVARDLKEAQAIVSQDPGYQAKVLDPSVHEWYVAIKSPQMLMSLLGAPSGSDTGQGSGGVRSGSSRGGGR